MTNFITADQVKQLSSLQYNVDNSKIENKIFTAQYGDIRPIIGADLYDELITQIEGDTLTSLNEKLLEYIQYALAHFVHARILVSLIYQDGNKGPALKIDEYATVITPDQVQLKLKDIEKEALTYVKFLTDYLQEHKADYPLYKVSCSSVPRTSNSMRVV